MVFSNFRLKYVLDHKVLVMRQNQSLALHCDELHDIELEKSTLCCIFVIVIVIVGLSWGELGGESYPLHVLYCYCIFCYCIVFAFYVIIMLLHILLWYCYCIYVIILLLHFILLYFMLLYCYWIACYRIGSECCGVLVAVCGAAGGEFPQEVSPLFAHPLFPPKPSHLIVRSSQDTFSPPKKLLSGFYHRLDGTYTFLTPSLSIVQRSKSCHTEFKILDAPKAWRFAHAALFSLVSSY